MLIAQTAAAAGGGVFSSESRTTARDKDPEADMAPLWRVQGSCVEAASFVPSVAFLLSAGAVGRDPLLPGFDPLVGPNCGLMGARAPKPLPCKTLACGLTRAKLS